VPDIRQLEVPHHQGQSYWMFAPANYTADQAWPILYCLDPAARGRVPVERFAAAAAFGFFLGTVPARPAPASQEAEKQAAQYDRWMERIQSADENERRSVIRLAQKDAAREQDSPARRVARRVIGGVSVGAMESTRELMAQERYRDAARTAEEAVFARPEELGRVVRAGPGKCGGREYQPIPGSAGAGGGQGLDCLGTDGSRAAAGQGAARSALCGNPGQDAPLILHRGFFGAIDDHHFERHLLRFQFQAEFLLQDHRQERLRIRPHRIQGLPLHCQIRGVLGNVEGEIVAPLQARHVDHRGAQHIRHHLY
jgi:hypothetical protein